MRVKQHSLLIFEGSTEFVFRHRYSFGSRRVQFFEDSLKFDSLLPVFLVCDNNSVVMLIWECDPILAPDFP